jgi:hypothetical protein
MRHDGKIKHLRVPVPVRFQHLPALYFLLLLKKSQQPGTIVCCDSLPTKLTCLTMFTALNRFSELADKDIPCVNTPPSHPLGMDDTRHSRKLWVGDTVNNKETKITVQTNK